MVSEGSDIYLSVLDLAQLIDRGIALLIEMTERFAANYDRCANKKIILNRVGELIKFKAANERHWSSKFEPIRTALPGMYRDKVTEGDRLLFVNAESLILVDVGDHDIYTRWETRKLSPREQREIFDRRKPVSQEIVSQLFQGVTSQELFAASPEEIITNDKFTWTYDAEVTSDWLIFLDEQQLKVRDLLLTEIVENRAHCHFDILAGTAGTGKTVILTQLAIDLHELGLPVKFIANPGVVKQLKRVHGLVPGLTSKQDINRGDIVLLDDPETVQDLVAFKARASKIGASCLIVALDPIQWKKRKSLEQFAKLIEPLSIKYLNVCYRQGAEVGKGALNYTDQMLTGLNPYADFEKVMAFNATKDWFLKYFVRDVVFSHEGGALQVLKGAVEERFTNQVARFRSRYDRWDWTPPLLLVWDENLSDLKNLKQTLKTVSRGLNAEDKNLQDVDSVRGVEYQEVILVISAATWEIFNTPRSAAGGIDWEARTPFHTFMTRAKDSVTVLVADADPTR